jgi:hypothetical protein
MLKNLILIFSVIAIMYSPLVAQNSPNAHQLTQSSFVAIDGKVIVSPGGKYTTAETEQVFLSVLKVKPCEACGACKENAFCITPSAP